ncbi:cupin domain-containing protein [candidate division KSB1 bacterium]
MTYIDFNTRKRIQIWEGISGPVFHSDQATFGHFTLEAGCILPVHRHPHEQWTNLIEGELEFNIDGEIKLMRAGMTAFIPSDIIHSAKVITECKVIDCFMPVREDFRELENKTQ